MSAPIGPGDWVECVAFWPHPRAPLAALSVGCIYQIDWVGEGVDCDGVDGAAVRVINDPLPSHCAWRADQFRPIYRPSSDFIDSLKQPAPPRECEAV